MKRYKVTVRTNWQTCAHIITAHDEEEACAKGLRAHANHEPVICGIQKLGKSNRRVKA